MPYLLKHYENTKYSEQLEQLRNLDGHDESTLLSQKVIPKVMPYLL